MLCSVAMPSRLRDSSCQGLRVAGTITRVVSPKLAVVISGDQTGQAIQEPVVVAAAPLPAVHQGAHRTGEALLGKQQGAQPELPAQPPIDFLEMAGFLHDPPAAVHPHEVRSHQAGSRLHHVDLGVEQDGLQEPADTAEGLVPGVGQLVAAALASMEFDDLALPAGQGADPGLALPTPMVVSPAWSAAGSGIPSSQSRSLPRSRRSSSRQDWT